MLDPTPERYDISSLPLPGSDAMPGLPSRDAIGNEPYRPYRAFGPYATSWIPSDWVPLRKGAKTGKVKHLRASAYLGRPAALIVEGIEIRGPLEQITDRRKNFRAKLAKIQDTIKACAASNLDRSRIPYLELKANETQFQIDVLDVMQHFWNSISLDITSELVDSDFVNEVSKARQGRDAERLRNTRKKPLPRFAKPGETAFAGNGIRPTNAIERGENADYWEQEGN